MATTARLEQTAKLPERAVIEAARTQLLAKRDASARDTRERAQHAREALSGVRLGVQITPDLYR